MDSTYTVKVVNDIYDIFKVMGGIQLAWTLDEFNVSPKQAAWLVFK